MKPIILFLLLVSVVVASHSQAQVPQVINYQGRIIVGSTNFDGTGQFKFALVDGGTNVNATATAVANTDGNAVTSVFVTQSGFGYISVPNVSITGGGGSGATAAAVLSNGTSGVVTAVNVTSGGSGYTNTPTVQIDAPPANILVETFWSNDNTSVGGAEPASAVSVNVSKGLYSVLLGDSSLPNMSAPIPRSIFTNPFVALRVWFNDGTHGSQQLVPDQRLGAVGYAMIAGGVPDGAITGSMIAYGAIYGSQLAPGAVGTAQLASDLQLSGTVGFSGNINLPSTTSGSAGVIDLGALPFLHAYGAGGVNDGNTFVGRSAGNFSLTGVANSALGDNVLRQNTTGNGNTGTGYQTLYSNTTGSYNTAGGYQTLYFNTGGSYNTASGAQALLRNTTGYSNTAIGSTALTNNTTGFENTGIGNQALISNTTGFDNTATGQGALFQNTTGSYNTATGMYALDKNTTGYSNTAIGSTALRSNTTGFENTASGNQALINNTTGYDNTASGQGALLNNTTGNRNTAYGYEALYSNTTRNQTTAIGFQALHSNTDGGYNSASGYQALYSNTTGSYNTATGYAALVNNTTGIDNTGTGLGALGNNTTGGNNTADGTTALTSNTTGSANTASGYEALASNTTGNNNTAFGEEALYNDASGSNNIALGYQAAYTLTSGSNNIDIGNAAVTSESNTIRIGSFGTHTRTFIAGIYAVTSSGGSAVFVNNQGQLGTTTSSRRYKQHIAPMADSSACLFKLHPVSFQYKAELDPAGIPQWGLIAEEVNEVNPDLVLRDDRGEIQTVRYEQVNAMLLNEFLKEHRRVEALQADMTALKQEIAKLNATSRSVTPAAGHRSGYSQTKK